MSGKHKKHGDKSVMSPFRKRSSAKNEPGKADGGKKIDAGTIPARYSGKRPPLTKSTSAFFPNSATNGVASEGGGTKTQQKSASVGRGAVSGLKGIWKRNSKKKTAVKMESEDWTDVGGASDHPSPSRELPRRLSLKRKNSVSSGDKVRNTHGVWKNI